LTLFTQALDFFYFFFIKLKIQYKSEVMPEPRTRKNPKTSIQTKPSQTNKEGEETIKTYAVYQKAKR